MSNLKSETLIPKENRPGRTSRIAPYSRYSRMTIIPHSG